MSFNLPRSFGTSLRKLVKSLIRNLVKKSSFVLRSNPVKKGIVETDIDRYLSWLILWFFIFRIQSMHYLGLNSWGTVENMISQQILPMYQFGNQAFVGDEKKQTNKYIPRWLPTQNNLFQFRIILKPVRNEWMI